MPNFISPNDKTIFHAIWNNKSASIAAILWIFLWRRENTPKWVLTALANYIILHDGMDIGMFNRLHHWQYGYIMQILNKSKQVPEANKKETIMRGLSSMFNAEARKRFVGGK